MTPPRWTTLLLRLLAPREQIEDVIGDLEEAHRRRLSCHTARAALEITDEDLSEAMAAAHAIGDDSLGHANERDYTHGTSAQRKRWFRRGFDSGEPRQCDTFAVKKYAEL